MQTDPHEAVRFARRLEGLFERERTVPSLSVRVDGAVHDHRFIFPHAWQARRAWIPPPTSPIWRLTRPGCSTDAAPIRSPRSSPALPGTALPSSITSRGPTRGSAPRSSTDRAIAFASSRARRPQRATTCRTGTPTTCAAWSKPSRRWTPTASGPPGPATGPDRSTPVAWPTRRWCTAGTRSAEPSTPPSRSTAWTSTSRLFAPLAAGDTLPAHGTIHLHATDIDGEWLITLGPAGISFEHGHAKGDVALRGTASDLLLWCWNRVPVDDRLEVFGDAAPLDLWRTAVVI